MSAGEVAAALRRTAGLMDARQDVRTRREWLWYRRGQGPRPNRGAYIAMDGTRRPVTQSVATDPAAVLAFALPASYGLDSMSEWGRAWRERWTRDGRPAARRWLEERRAIYAAMRELLPSGPDSPPLTSDDVRRLAEAAEGGGSR